jgi:dienelactone hydrolase
MTELRAMAVEHDGTRLVGQIAIPQGPGPHPAVMVMHTALGPGEMMRDRARSLCALGYAAVATDMYGKGELADDMQTAGSSMTALLEVPQRLRARTIAWYEQLKAMPEIDPHRISAIGFCFGGLCVLELARSGAHIQAAVSYHGLLTTSQPAKPGTIPGHVVIYTGAKDPYAPAGHVEALRQEMSSAGARFQITEFSEACHGFTDLNAEALGRPGIAYDAVADRVSWAGTVALLAEINRP